MLTMSTKKQQKPRKTVSLRGKRLKPSPSKKQARYKITIRSNLEHRRRSEILLMRNQNREDAA